MSIKNITSAGMEWTVGGPNGRETTHKGRYFLAARRGPAMPWKITELDRPLSETGTAEHLRHFGGEYETKQLTQAVMEICGGKL